MHKALRIVSESERASLGAAQTPDRHPESPTRVPVSRSASRADRDFALPEAMQLLRIGDICQLLRISKPTFWRLRRYADFPPPTAVTDHVIAWRGTEVEAWITRRRRQPRD